jgi:hypothetical protein
MIERDTLISWVHELVDFVNDSPTNPLFPPAWQQWSPDRVAAVRRVAKRNLSLLPAKNPRHIPQKLLDAAERWLDRVTGDSLVLAPMAGPLSLSAEGRLQIAPRFDDPEIQFAVTFCELIQPQPVALVRRCEFHGCADYFVHVPRRARPYKTCTRHRSAGAINTNYRVREHRARTQ